MIKTLKLALAAAMLFVAAPAFAAPEIGATAPDFEAVDIDGNAFKLSDHKGKNIVLEWTNHQCPFVVKHYDTGNMQKIQKAATDDGVVWVSIVSSADGRQGHTTPEEAKKIVADANAHPSVKILDASGEIGKLYDAQTTPHMYVINKEGALVYAGAIDDNSSPRHETVDGAKNYVTAALADIKADRPVEVSSTQAYGCGVKYNN